MNYLYAKLNKETENVRYKGENTNTVEMNVNNKTNTISANVKVDSALSNVSTRPVANKAIKSYVDNKVIPNSTNADTTATLTNITIDGITYLNKVGDSIDFDDVNRAMVLEPPEQELPTQQVTFYDIDITSTQWANAVAGEVVTLDSSSLPNLYNMLIDAFSSNHLPVLRLIMVEDDVKQWITLFGNTAIDDETDNPIFVFSSNGIIIQGGENAVFHVLVGTGAALLRCVRDDDTDITINCTYDMQQDPTQFSNFEINTLFSEISVAGLFVDAMNFDASAVKLKLILTDSDGGSFYCETPLTRGYLRGFDSTENVQYTMGMFSGAYTAGQVDVGTMLSDIGIQFSLINKTMNNTETYYVELAYKLPHMDSYEKVQIELS